MIDRANAVQRKQDYVIPARIIFAPSGSGKSHWILNSKPAKAVDGDIVISTLLGWPPGKWWLERNSGVMHATQLAALVAYSVSTGNIIVFNGRNPEFLRVQTCIVRIDPKLVAARTSTPIELTNRQFEELVEEYPSAPVFNDFDNAYKWQLNHATKSMPTGVELNAVAEARSTKRG